MPDLIQHPLFFWIPACAEMTILRYLIAGLIKAKTIFLQGGDKEASNV